jgi:hypothetical protein
LNVIAPRLMGNELANFPPLLWDPVFPEGRFHRSFLLRFLIMQMRWVFFFLGSFIFFSSSENQKWLCDGYIRDRGKKKQQTHAYGWRVRPAAFFCCHCFPYRFQVWVVARLQQRFLWCLVCSHGLWLPPFFSGAYTMWRVVFSLHNEIWRADGGRW